MVGVLLMFSIVVGISFSYTFGSGWAGKNSPEAARPELKRDLLVCVGTNTIEPPTANFKELLTVVYLLLPTLFRILSPKPNFFSDYGAFLDSGHKVMALSCQSSAV